MDKEFEVKWTTKGINSLSLRGRVTKSQLKELVKKRQGRKYRSEKVLLLKFYLLVEIERIKDIELNYKGRLVLEGIESTVQFLENNLKASKEDYTEAIKEVGKNDYTKRVIYKALFGKVKRKPEKDGDKPEASEKPSLVQRFTISTDNFDKNREILRSIPYRSLQGILSTQFSEVPVKLNSSEETLVEGLAVYEGLAEYLKTLSQDLEQ